PEPPPPPALVLPFAPLPPDLDPGVPPTALPPLPPAPPSVSLLKVWLMVFPSGVLSLTVLGPTLKLFAIIFPSILTSPDAHNINHLVLCSVIIKVAFLSIITLLY